MKKVSVIVILYKPDLKKIVITLNSILKQVNIDYEILISDDGSDVDYFPQIINFMHRNGFEDYKLIKNEQNVGTVKNILGALEKAKGKYIFITSPGDLLYNYDTLYDFYSFSYKNDAKIVFGNAVCYNITDKINILPQLKCPLSPKSYDVKCSYLEAYTSFFFGNYILGAKYFREKECALKYFKKIQDCCKYVEDTTSSMVALANGEKIVFYNRNIVWYEYGTGISTSGSNEWQEIIKSEMMLVMNKLKNEYSKDRVIDWAVTLHSTDNLFKKGVALLNKPLILLYFLKFKIKSKFFKERIVNFDDSVIRDAIGIEEYKNASN